jgi:hypothetical protein
LMVVDATFTSIGLNYFTAVVPEVCRKRKNKEPKKSLQQQTLIS